MVMMLPDWWVLIRYAGSSEYQIAQIGDARSALDCYERLGALYKGARVVLLHCILDTAPE